METLLIAAIAAYAVLVLVDLWTRWRLRYWQARLREAQTRAAEAASDEAIFEAITTVLNQRDAEAKQLARILHGP